jgi:hypothetical protein
MSDDQRPGGKAAQHDEPTDEVEAHAAKAGHNKAGMTDEVDKDNDEVEAHGSKFGSPKAG